MSDFTSFADPNAPQMPPGYYGQQQPQPSQFGGYPGQPFPNYQNYQFGDPSMPMGPPQNIAAPYEFRRRINKMNWDMLAKIDVATIAKTNDVQSIEFLMSPIAFANISNEDSEHFGSQACLHAFLLLQLSVEYLLFKLNTTPVPSFVQQSRMQQPPSQQQQNQLITNYEARIDLLNKDIKTRDILINSLSEKMRKAESERDALKAKMQMKTKVNESYSDITNEISEIPVKQHKKKRKNDESGLLHQDSELEEYRESKIKIKQKDKKPRSVSSKKHSSHESSTFNSYSYYDYSESDIIPPPQTKKKRKNKETAKKTSVHSLGLDDDWDSSSPWN